MLQVSWSILKRQEYTLVTQHALYLHIHYQKKLVCELGRQAKILALELGVVGFMNTQFAVKDGEVYLIEVNPRASRTVPFVAKAIGQPIANIAAKVMAGMKLSEFDLTLKAQKIYSSKRSRFSVCAFSWR